MFGYSDLVVDPRNLILMRDSGCPVTADITHALQQPTGRSLEVICCFHLQLHQSAALCTCIARLLHGHILTPVQPG